MTTGVSDVLKIHAWRPITHIDAPAKLRNYASHIELVEIIIIDEKIIIVTRGRVTLFSKPFEFSDSKCRHHIFLL